MRRGAVVACMAVIAGAAMPPAAHGAHSLGVSTAGDGTVTSADGRIDCGDDCSARYGRGRRTTLKATSGPHTVFSHWTGACVGTAPRCVVVVDRKSRARATFVAGTRRVRLAVGGPGTVVSDPAGLRCGSTAIGCSAFFTQGTSVRLSAVPDADGVFDSWRGGTCGGQLAPACDLAIARADFDGAALFRHATPAVGDVQLSVTSQERRVTSSPAGIYCPPTCSAAFSSGTQVTLTSDGSTRWGGGCVGTLANCTLILDQTTGVTATSESGGLPTVKFGLSVTVSGPGGVSGGYTYESNTIRCNGTSGSILDCQEQFQPGATVKLQAVRNNGGRFVRWTSFCADAGRKPQCDVRMSAPKTVGAVFRRK